MKFSSIFNTLSDVSKTVKAVTALAALLAGAHVHAFGIDKLSMQLDSNAKFKAVDSFSVFNDTSDETVFVKAQVLKWDVDVQGQITTTPSTDLAVSPSVTRVKPGDRGIFRIRYAGPPLSGEGNYRILFQEIRMPAGTNAQSDDIDDVVKGSVSLGLAMTVPVYVSDHSAPTSALEKVQISATPADKGMKLHIDNKGDRHVTVSKYKVDGVETERGLGVVLANRERELMLDVPTSAKKLEFNLTYRGRSKWVDASVK